MNMYGMCVVDDFLGMTYGLSILNEGTLFQRRKNSLNFNYFDIVNTIFDTHLKFIIRCLFSVHGLYAAGVFQVSVYKLEPICHS